MKIQRRIDVFGRAVLATVFTLACVANAGAQTTEPGNVVTLRPQDTGRRITTFDPGRQQRPARTPRTPRADQTRQSTPRTARATSRPAQAFTGSRMAVKMDMVYAIAGQTPNLTMEYALSPRGSVFATVGYNNWNTLWDFSKKGPAYDPTNLYKRRFNHFLVKAGYRYWFTGTYGGWFADGGLFYSKYRVGDINFMSLLDRGYDYYGRLYGLNVACGWMWRFHERWGAEFSLGLGVASISHDRSLIMTQGGEYQTVNPERLKRIFAGPTGGAIKLVFIIK